MKKRDLDERGHAPDSPDDEDTIETVTLEIGDTALLGDLDRDAATGEQPLPAQSQAFIWLKHMESELERLQGRWGEVEIELDDRSTRIERLEGELAAARKSSDELDRKLELEAEVARQLRADLEQRDAALAERTARAAALAESLADADADAERKDAEIAKLGAEVASVGEEFAKLRGELAHVTEERDALAKQLAAELEDGRRAMSLLDRNIERINILGTSLQRLEPGRSRHDRPAGAEGGGATGNVHYLSSAERAAPSRTRMLVSLDSEHPLRFALNKENTTIGRSHESDIRINGQFVSRVHARLLSHGPGTVIEDLGSKNGVFVNSQPITRCALKDGDIVNLGGKLDLRYVELEI